MENNPKTMHAVSDTLLINAMPTAVFEAVANPNKPFLTINLFTHLEVVGSQRSGKGTIYRWRFTLPLGIRFQFDEVVIEWIEPERFCYRAISGWEMEATSQITPENNQTRITFHLR